MCVCVCLCVRVCVCVASSVVVVPYRFVLLLFSCPLLSPFVLLARPLQSRVLPGKQQEQAL